MFSLTITAHSWCFLSVSGADRVTLDTPMNRKFMPDADFGSWTSLEHVTEWVQSPDVHSFDLFTALSMLISHTAGIWYYFFWRVWLYNAKIFHISALKYWSKLRLKCIRTQADMVYFSTDMIYLMTFDPQPTAASVLVYLIYAVCCGGRICVWLFIVGPRISDTLA